MSENNKQNITLANNAIADAIKDSVKNEIDASIAGYAVFTHAPELLESFKAIDDPIKQAELFQRYMSMVEEHQKVQNEALAKLVDNGIEKSKKNIDHDIEKKKIILDSKIERDKDRALIFNNRKFLILLMCFPIIMCPLVVAVSKSVFLAIFTILMWYGVFLAFYFSQSDALNRLLQNLPLKKWR